jgi:hypothetical protein
MLITSYLLLLLCVIWSAERAARDDRELRLLGGLVDGLTVEQAAVPGEGALIGVKSVNSPWEVQHGPHTMHLHA